MSDPDAIVRQFVASWSSLDLDRILSFFTDDALYLNVPMPPAHRGKKAIREAIAGFLEGVEAMEFVILHQAESPQGVVLNERLDRFRIDGRWLELPVMGAFELRDGKIAAWRDYFDLEQFTGQLGR
ncbi:MAG: limonene-1,2-epoxide hydrolase [Porticoccaceae bacterium]|nr:MAG: limonene-1,2-epoxide hydrolase [Porticoccaceae bacterium]